MKNRHTVLQVEELSSRILPSASPFSLYGSVPSATHVVHNESPPVVQLAPQQHSLVGMAVGGYTSNSIVHDVGATYHLNGLGYFAKLGSVTVTGDIHGVGFIQHGNATGTLTFTNVHGSVTIELTGPEQGSFAPLPHQFKYKVIGGTGAYQNFHDAGTLQLQLFGSSGNPGNNGHGVFAIQI